MPSSADLGLRKHLYISIGHNIISKHLPLVKKQGEVAAHQAADQPGIGGAGDGGVVVLKNIGLSNGNFASFGAAVECMGHKQGFEAVVVAQIVAYRTTDPEDRSSIPTERWALLSSLFKLSISGEGLTEQH